MHLAARAGHLEIVKYLVKEGEANVEAKDKQGFTPLRCAKMTGYKDIVQFLKSKGAEDHF